MHTFNPVSDDVLGRLRVSLYLPKDTGWQNITTVLTHTGFIWSHGYPFHYTPGMMWLWEIVFGDNVFVCLLFSNISFNVYEVSM